MGERVFGLDPDTLERIAKEVKSIHDIGIEICLVVGGGNIFRGIQSAAHAIERATGDYMGMLATVMNSLAIQGALEQLGVDTRVQSAIPMSTVSEPYVRRRAVRHLEKGRVVIFAAGTGNPSSPRIRYGGGVARLGDGLRRAVQGDQGGWSLQRRPGPQSGGRTL